MRRTLLAAVLVLAVAPASPAAASERPNVIVVMTDDQRHDDVQVMPRTRALIGGQGTTFTNSFASYPLCCPSRATLLTGQYSHNHGVEYNRPPWGGYQALDGDTTLAVALQRAGYHTMHIGKYLNGYGAVDPHEIPPGWSDWYGSIDPSTYRYQGYTLNENGDLRTYQRYQTDHYAQLATELIRERAGAPEPFFLNLAFLAPHADASAQGQAVPAPRHDGAFAAAELPRPPSFNEPDVSDKPSFIAERPLLTPAQIEGIEGKHQARRETLLAVDEAVAAIVATLQQTGQLDDTVIVFTSDNGFFQGEHRIPASKYLVYEEAVRVPLLIRGPGVARGAQETLVANIDLAPTILDLAHGQPLVTPDGRSLLPLLRNPAATWDRDLLLETGENPRLPVYQAIRTERFLYAEHDTGERELYDLHLDPYQRASHADPHYTAVQARMSARLAELRDCSGPSCQ